MIPGFLHMAYETRTDAKTIHTRWISRLEQDGSRDFYLPFGYGDGGGGPTRDDLEQIRRQRDLQGAPKLYWMTPADYLKKRNNGSLPVYRGELYFPCHRGTYTTQALIKKGNRRAEHVLRVWEMLAAMAAFTGRAEYPTAALEKTWKLLLVNQFHDILPGSSIARVYEQARQDIARVRDTSLRGARDALLTFCRNGLGLTVFNPSSHRITRIIRADERFAAGAVTREGVRFQAAAYKDEALVLACLEPMSAVTMYPAEVPVHSTADVRRQGSNYVMQNSRLRAVISKKGELLSLVLLQDDRERVRTPSNVFHLFRDLPRMFDNMRRRLSVPAACLRS